MILKKQITEVPNACNYCRKLMKLENPPETLELYRGEMLCLTVDVKEASKLVLNENSLRYSRFKNTDSMERLKAWKKRHVSGL